MKTRGMSLRTKVTLTLTLTTIISVLFVGFTAKWLVLEKFNDQSMQWAFDNFSHDVIGFVSKHGSWEQGVDDEGFRNYVIHNRRPKRPHKMLAGPPPGEAQPIPPPPFRFVLTDLQGIVVHGSNKYPVGQSLNGHLRRDEIPILIDNKAVLIAVPLGQPNLSKLDLTYLNAVDKALTYAVIIAGAIAIILGIIFGNRLSSSLYRLSESVSSMRPGEIRKDIVIKSKDEVEVLANTFNKMSHYLADAYEELEQAHDKVTEQATLLLELSIKDELTGLYNRRYFRERADHFYNQANRYQQPLSIMLGDIDFFKRINDTYGHAIGDDVLRTISSLLQTNLRETDLLARYGGEEFVIIFPETDLYSASELCERIRQTIEGHSWEEIAADLKVTMSMGINADTQLSDFEQMLINADEKLYQAKGNGRNQIVI